MGWEVIAKCHIDINEGKLTSEQQNKIEEILKEAETFDIQINDDYVYCEMSGNKGVSYEPLDKIKELLLASPTKLKFSISASAYVEATDDGYSFDSEDDVEQE